MRSPSFRGRDEAAGPESITPVAVFSLGNSVIAKYLDRGYGFSDAQLQHLRAAPE